MTRRTQIRWLITAGPTCEDIDPVRFISNRSSGAMGYAVARAAALQGGDVTIVSGPVGIAPPDGCRVVAVRSARQMYDAALSAFDGADAVVMTAAVADYRPRVRAATKLKKNPDGLVLELEPTEDILAELGRRKSSQVLIGFALESPNDASGDGITPRMRASAEDKMSRKRLDAIVLNGPAAIGALASVIAVRIGTSAWREYPRAGKDEHAAAIVEFTSALVRGRGPT